MSTDVGLTWTERAAADPSLRAFVAEIARAGIALDTARYNEAHWRRVAAMLDEKVERLEAQLRSLRKEPRAATEKESLPLAR
jgi:hypothetical protein